MNTHPATCRCLACELAVTLPAAVRAHCRVCGGWATGTPVGLRVIRTTAPHSCAVPGYVDARVGTPLRVDEDVAR